MKCKLLGVMAGPDGIKHPGTIVDFDEETAQRLVIEKQIEIVVEKPAEEKEEKPEFETAEAEPGAVETADAPKKRRGKWSKPS